MYPVSKAFEMLNQPSPVTALKLIGSEKVTAPPDDSYEAYMASERERVKLLKIRKCLDESSIGKRFMGMTFEDYRPTGPKAERVKAACQSYADAFTADTKNSLLMIGGPGTGKNMLSAIIGQTIIQRGHSFLHTTAMRLVRRVKDSWKTPDQQEQIIIDSFIAPDLLVIDEVGVQFGSAAEQLYLTEIINDRYEAERPTILLSNLTLKELGEIMGPRVIDRFHDDGSSVLVFDWQSYRRERRAA